MSVTKPNRAQISRFRRFHDSVDTGSSAGLWQCIWWMIAALLLLLFHHVTYRWMLSVLRFQSDTQGFLGTFSKTMTSVEHALHILSCSSRYLLLLSRSLSCQRNVCFPLVNGIFSVLLTRYVPWATSTYSFSVELCTLYTSFLHHGGGALSTTAVDSRCVMSDTKETGLTVLSRVLDTSETAVAAATEGHCSKQHIGLEQITIKNRQEWSKQWHT